MSTKRKQAKITYTAEFMGIMLGLPPDAHIDRMIYDGSRNTMSIVVSTDDNYIDSWCDNMSAIQTSLVPEGSEIPQQAFSSDGPNPLTEVIQAYNKKHGKTYNPYFRTPKKLLPKPIEILDRLIELYQ